MDRFSLRPAGTVCDVSKTGSRSLPNSGAGGRRAAYFLGSVLEKEAATSEVAAALDPLICPTFPAPGRLGDGRYMSDIACCTVTLRSVVDGARTAMSPSQGMSSLARRPPGDLSSLLSQLILY